MPWLADKVQRTNKILILEPDAEGHSHEWLEHLMVFVGSESIDTQICLVVPEALQRSLLRTLPAAAADRIQVMALSPREKQSCTVPSLTLAAFARWRTMRRYLRLTGADQGFFLTLDLLSLPLALGLGAAGKGLSGILFRPSVHYGEIGPYRPSLGERLRDLRKDLLYRLMLRNPAVKRVLSLDPFFPTYAQRHYRHGSKVVSLPDPTHPPGQAATGGLSGEFVPPGRVGFLLFGYLAERKGPLAVLDALLLLPPEIIARIAVLFAGKVAPQIQTRLDQRLVELRRKCPDLWLRIDDRRLESSELASLVQKSDVVLAPYQRFVGSSGVLLWAALNGRPVLAQDYGLVGRLTREHHLGISVDSGDPSRLACEIARMVEQGPASFFDPPAAARFAKAQTPRNFASLVLSA
jgi:glycosyltransferase involved in cell wall biosynthesis